MIEYQTSIIPLTPKRLLCQSRSVNCSLIIPFKATELWREHVAEVADNLADVLTALPSIGEIDRPRKKTLEIIPEGLAKRLRTMADRLDKTAGKRARPKEVCMSAETLVERLLQTADNAERLAAHAAKVEDIPLPIRAGITDRLIQLTCLIRLLARQIDHEGKKTANVPVDA